MAVLFFIIVAASSVNLDRLTQFDECGASVETVALLEK